MLAAYNMARWRKAQGMTQEELGAELGGWTKTAVSAAERSWDGREGRVRQFDVDLIADLASIFRVPFQAFFLPPADDGEGTVYFISADDGMIPMNEYFRFLTPETYTDFAADTPAAVAYQQAIISAIAKYVGGEAREALGQPTADLAAEEQIEAALQDARTNRQELLGLYSLIERLAADNEILQDALERALAVKRSER